jgi:hypothetical protein
MGHMPDRIIEKSPVAKELEFCTQHYYSHLMHSLQVVGACHPDVCVGIHASYLYEDMCSLFHLPIESLEHFKERLKQITWPGGTQPDTFMEAMILLDKPLSE